MLEAQTLAVPMSRTILTVASKCEQNDMATGQEKSALVKRPMDWPHIFHAECWTLSLDTARRLRVSTFPGSGRDTSH